MKLGLSFSFLFFFFFLTTQTNYLINRFIVCFMISIYCPGASFNTGKSVSLGPYRLMPYSEVNVVWNFKWSGMVAFYYLSWSQNRDFLMNIFHTCVTLYLGNKTSAARTRSLCSCEVCLLHRCAFHEAPRPYGIREKGSAEGDSMKEILGDGWPTATPVFLLSSFRLLIQE